MLKFLALPGHLGLTISLMVISWLRLAYCKQLFPAGSHGGAVDCLLSFGSVAAERRFVRNGHLNAEGVLETFIKL